MVNMKLVPGKGFIDLDDPQNQPKLTPEEIKTLFNENNNVQSLTMAKLEGLTNLENQVAALKEKPGFRDLGEALTPLMLSKPCTTPQNKPRKLSSLKAWLQTKHYKTLDLFAGAATFVCWIAATGWIIQSFGLTYASIIGLAVFWLGFIIVFRLMIGGLLD